MKPSKIAEAVSRGLDGDLSMWDDCPERAGDGSPTKRIELGSGFTLGSTQSGFIIYHDDGFSMTMDVLSHDGGIFTGPDSELVLNALGARRAHVELDPGELERFVRMTLFGDGSESGQFMLSDELRIDADECDDCPSRVLCTVSYSSFDGKASFTGEGEAVYLPEGPSVVGDGFSLTVPLDLLTLRRFRERMYSSDRDTRAYLGTAVFDGAPDAASSRRAELSRALTLCRPGSRMARLPNDPDDADRGEW